MDKEIEDSTWDKDSITLLNKFENHRNLVLRATKRLFSKFYKENLAGDETVLEMGSGTSFLRRNWPLEFKGRWIELDSQSAFLDESRRRIQNGIYIQGSAYELPFPNESLDVVCGFGSYDVLNDLKAAVNEASRVLRKGGLFFHMLDLLPCDTPIINDLKRNKLPLQTKGYEGDDGYLRTISISFIPKERLDDYHKAEAKLKDTESDFESVLKQSEKIWSKYRQQVDTHNHFEGKLVDLLKSHFDTETVESGPLSAEYKGKRTEQQRSEKREPFFFSHDAGRHGHYANELEYNVREQKFPGALKFWLGYPKMCYKILRLISPSLAQRIEPYSLEISTVRYAKARK